MISSGGKKSGFYRPLSDADQKRIIDEAIGLFNRSGMRVYSATARNYLNKAGAEIAEDGLTVRFPKSLMKDAISSALSCIVLHGRESEHNIVLEDSRVYYGTGGTAIYVMDLDTGKRRQSTLEDVKLNARLTDALEHVHLFTINVFPNDIKDNDHVDINRFYWSLRNTSKHVMGGVTLVQAVKKGAPVIAGSVGSISNLQTMGIAVGAVERGMINFATAQIAQSLGLPFYSTGGNSDAKIEDAQAGIESAVSNLLVGMAGANYIHDAAGLFDTDLTISYDKLVIDNEIIGMCDRVIQGNKVTDETLAIDMIEKVGPGGDFLAQEHTVLHMYDEFFNPRLSDRSSYTDWISSGHPDMKKKARKKLAELIASHNPCYINEAKDKEIRSAFPEIRD